MLLSCDADGDEEGVKTVTFGFDGDNFAIELCPAQRDQLAGALGEYIGAEPAGPGQPSRCCHSRVESVTYALGRGPTGTRSPTGDASRLPKNAYEAASRLSAPRNPVPANRLHGSPPA
jgi:hypothetical protein